MHTGLDDVPTFPCIQMKEHPVRLAGLNMKPPKPSRAMGWRLPPVLCMVRTDHT